MEYTIHVPNEFQHIADLEDIAHENKLTINRVQNEIKSFQVSGNISDLSTYLELLEKYVEQGIIPIESDSKIKLKSKINGIKIKKHLTNKTAVPYFTPTQIASIYGLTKTPSSRVNIAIIELGGGYETSDLNAYWSYLKLNPIPNVYPISVNGAKNSPGQDADAEVVLDIEIIGAICPNSNIYVYFAPNTNQGFYNAISAAINNVSDPVSVISISWGGPENLWSSSTLTAFNSLFQTAASKGITVCVASGDNGSSDGESTGSHVDFPSSSPWVLACGGTRLTCPSGSYANSTTKEIVWGTVTGNGATGGGYSTVFAKPSYQSTVNSKTTRGVPDVCGVADPETGWLIYLDGQYTVIGGTSAVAPMWAAYLASNNYKQFFNTALYSLYKSNKNIVHDIVTGNDGAYSAAVGWDPASGLGSPNGQLLSGFL